MILDCWNLTNETGQEHSDDLTCWQVRIQEIAFWVERICYMIRDSVSRLF